MRWIVKLSNGTGFCYVDLEDGSEVGAVAKALEANPSYWLVRAWPLSEAERQAIIRGNPNSGDPIDHL